ncbi:MAG: tetratricopeptide repeat protein [Candidatus Binatia bacterium]
MQIRKTLLPLLAAFLLLSSCAILHLDSGAQYEFDQGLALFNRGLYDQAITRFHRATEIDPNFGRAYLYLGRSHVSLKRWRQALPPLRTAYRLSPEDTKREAFDFLIDALFAVALDDFKIGNWSSSVGHFREVLELQPTSGRGRSEMAKALIAQGGDSMSRGNVSQAISAYSEAVKLSPNSFDAIFGLAKAFFRNGEFHKARQAAQDAIRVAPANREAQSLFKDLQGR